MNQLHPVVYRAIPSKDCVQVYKYTMRYDPNSNLEVEKVVRSLEKTCNTWEEAQAYIKGKERKYRADRHAEKVQNS
jgi:hypothetical protein